MERARYFGARYDEGIPQGWRPLWDSFARALRAENRSEETIAGYAQAIKQLAILTERPTPSATTRQDVEAFVSGLLRRHTAATAANRFNSLRRFFNWLVAEDEIEASPLARLHPPKVPDAPPPVLELGDLSRLLGACAGGGFDARRDLAIIRLLIDSGMRRGELASMTVDGTLLDEGRAMVDGKTDKRWVPFGKKAARDIDRYLRLRALRADADAPNLWLGQHGPLTGTGLLRIVKRRAKAAKIDARVYAHLFRHTFSHMWQASHGSDGDLMAITGWKSPAMARKYGRSAAASRAWAAHKDISPGDRL